MKKYRAIDCKEHKSTAQAIGFHQFVVGGFHLQVFMLHAEIFKDMLIICLSGTSFLFTYEQCPMFLLM